MMTTYTCSVDAVHGSCRVTVLLEDDSISNLPETRRCQRVRWFAHYQFRSVGGLCSAVFVLLMSLFRQRLSQSVARTADTTKSHHSSPAHQQLSSVRPSVRAAVPRDASDTRAVLLLASCLFSHPTDDALPTNNLHFRSIITCR